MSEQHLPSRIQKALRAFQELPFSQAGRNFFQELGFASNKILDVGESPNDFLSAIDPEGKFPREITGFSRWQRVAFLFQLSNDEIPTLSQSQQHLPLPTKQTYQRIMSDSFVFLALDLEGEDWTRTQLARITREFNRLFPMPVILLFRCVQRLSLAVIDRRPHQRHNDQDVIEGRISILKDIHCISPHRGHISILEDLAFPNLCARYEPRNFSELYEAWLNTLSVQTLNKRFYQELANWYFWTQKEVRFPQGQPLDSSGYPSVAVIRLLTRLIFVWFIKEKGLIPEELFVLEKLRDMLRCDPTTHPEESHYYKAILQNLFFATLNTEQEERRWHSKSNGGLSSHYLISHVYRYKEEFLRPDEIFALFSTIPFLNGGLFECLDRELSAKDLKRYPDYKAQMVREGKHDVLRVDGFSTRPDNPLSVPNKLFFSREELVDLNPDYNTKEKRYVVHGIIDILSRYKFTMEENTPVEEEVALDPELLGKVFENLLASYNEDTGSTARSHSGSFYTPREVVDFMVDEAMIAYFLQQCTNETKKSEEHLRHLLSFTQQDHQFSATETVELIDAIERLRVLDPACGSGAFPMGMLQKLLHVLEKLDPGNTHWKARIRESLEKDLQHAHKIPDVQLRSERIEQAEAALDRFERDFSDLHYVGYSRKIYLIERCLYGVDIQPIAVQIAKLRFFISLIVSQKVDPSKPNSNVTALPNLETKIIAANSLLPIERSAQLFLRDPQIDAKEAELHAATTSHRSARTGKTKQKYQERIYTLLDELAQLLEKDRFLSQSAAQQLAHWNPFDQNRASDFFDPEWMFQLQGGFDIVIGNPPYVRQEKIKDLKPVLRHLYHCYTGTADLYVYFYERGIQLLKPGGAFAFVTSNKWYRTSYGQKLREWLHQQARLHKLIDFGDEAIFTALAYPTIVIASRRPAELQTANKKENVQVLVWQKGFDVTALTDVFAKQSFSLPQHELSPKGWQLAPPIQRRLLEHLRTAGIPLGKYCHDRFYYGIKTGFNEAFVISGDCRAALIKDDPRSDEIIKPFLRGRDIKRWHVQSPNLWLIFIPWHFPLHEDSSITGVSTVAEREFEKQYPAVYAHLRSHKTELSARNKAETGVRYEWYALQRWGAEYWQEFEQPKIIVPAIENGVNYAFDVEGYFSNDKTTIIVSEDWSYLLAVLNSSVSWWFTQQTFSSKQGGFFEFKPMYISQVPIVPISKENKAIVDFIVHVVLKKTEQLPRFEQLLNAFVYELFFPDELHGKGMHFFEAVKEAGVERWMNPSVVFVPEQIKEWAEQIFATEHPLYAMLFDLQGLDVVRIIESPE